MALEQKNLEQFMAYIYKTGRIELYEQIKRYGNLVRGRVLDVGGGNFPRYKYLFRFSEYISMDVSEGKNVDVVGKIEKIPFSENSFDSIICTQVLGDVFDLENAFRELNRVLKPGGVALITENLFDPLHSEPRDFWRFTQHSLRRLSENAGFRVKVLEHRGGYWSMMAQLKARYWIELLDAHRKSWLARPLSSVFKICGTLARWLDRQDQSAANKKFTHGYLLIAEKEA